MGIIKVNEQLKKAGGVICQIRGANSPFGAGGKTNKKCGPDKHPPRIKII
jgi:hypothetical protein